MTRLIDADALKKTFEVTQYNDIDDLTRTEKLIDDAPTVFDEKAYSDGYAQGTCDCKCAHESKFLIDENGKITPIRPQGKWIYSTEFDKEKGYGGYCSLCKCDMPMFIEDWEQKYCETDYCPNCGADMREADND